MKRQLKNKPNPRLTIERTVKEAYEYQGKPNYYDVTLELEGSLKDAIKQLQKLQKKYGHLGQLRIDVGYVYNTEWYGGRSEITLKYSSLETDEEYNQRMESYKAQEEARRQNYERLKKEFE